MFLQLFWKYDHINVKKNKPKMNVQLYKKQLKYTFL